MNCDSSQCKTCQSKRIIIVDAKCNDMCWVRMNDNSTTSMEGYVPNDLGIGGGGDVEFKYCADCGKIVGEFPLPKTILEEVLLDETINEFYDTHFAGLKPNETIGYLKKKLDYILCESKKIDQKLNLYNFINTFCNYYTPNLTKRMPSKIVFLDMYNNNNWKIDEWEKY